MWFRKEFHCPECGSSQAYRSRPRSIPEKYLLPLLLYQTVRCAGCFRRTPCRIWVPVQKAERIRGARHAAA